jgi:hypothetical protein
LGRAWLGLGLGLRVWLGLRIGFWGSLGWAWLGLTGWLWLRVLRFGSRGSSGPWRILLDKTAQHLLVLFQAFRSGFAFTIDKLAVVADSVGAVALAISIAGVEGSFVRSASFRRFGSGGSWGSLVGFLVLFWRRFVLGVVGISFRQSLLWWLLLWRVRYKLTAQDLFLFRVFHAFGSRWALAIELLSVVADSVGVVVLAVSLTRHEVATRSRAWSGWAWALRSWVRLLILSTVDGAFESLLWRRIRLWRVRHVLAAQDLFLFLVLQAFGSRWALAIDRVPIVAHGVSRVVLAVSLTRHQIATRT